MPDQTHRSQAKRDLLEKYLRSEIPKPSENQNDIPRRESGAVAPLSLTQQQVWLHHHIVPGEITVYNETITIHRTGTLDPAVLESCLREIVRRHEIWRTTFEVTGDDVVQIVHPVPDTFPLRFIDLSQLPEAERDAEALRLATHDARHPFDLHTGPLLRALLISLSDQRHRIYMTLHHLIFDAVTAYSVLVPELEALYEAFSAGQPSPLPEPRLQYADFTCWQRRNLPQTNSSEHHAYWRKQMSRQIPLCHWPNDHPRPTVETHRGAIERFVLPPVLVQRLRALSQQAGVSFYMTLLAGFVAVLKRYTEQDEIVIGSLTAGRNQAELEQMAGHFVNPLTLRIDVSGNPSFRELLLRVRNVLLEGLAHEALPFAEVVKLSQQKNDPSRHPLFQIIVSQQPRMQHVAPGWELITEEVSNGGSKLDLIVVIDDRGDTVSGPITYNPDLFDVTTIRRAVEHWRTLLAGAADDQSRGILDLPILTERERNQIVFDWNRTAVEFPRSKTLHQLFEDQVKRTPDAIAVTFEGQFLTYQELNRRADGLASHLRTLGVRPDVPVGLFLERSFQMITGVLGVLKAGGTCLPLDPAYPADRLSFMLGETQAPILITHSRLRNQLPVHNAEIVYLDAEQDLPTNAGLASDLPAMNDENIAYIIYTSGSTGQPKGVRVTHRGLVNSTLARTVYYQETLRSFLLLSSFTFDSSLAGIFWTLTTGGNLVLPPDQSRWELQDLPKIIQQQEVSHLLCVPSLYLMLLETGTKEQFKSLQVAIVAGEACPSDLVRQHFVLVPHANLYNEYGPTETTVWCSVYKCRPQSDSLRVPIGRPPANVQLYLLDAQMQPVPIGVAGELFIGGAGVSAGYLHRPELNALRFVPNRFSGTVGDKLYRTGDRVRYLADGNLEWLERVDGQVKLRGYRIELGEIEAVLETHPVVEQAVVAVRTEGEQQHLVAYVTLNGTPPTAGELRRFLRARLPEHMVPAAYSRVEQWPLLPNGKVDRKGVLRATAVSLADSEPGGAPRTKVECGLVGIWQKLLNVEKVGIDQNFFELGGHSLLAMRVMAHIRSLFGVELPVRRLFEEPTLAGLAAAVEEAQASGVKARTPVLQSRPRPAATASASPEALVAQLDNLSPTELQALLRRVLRKPSA